MPLLPEPTWTWDVDIVSCSAAGNEEWTTALVARPRGETLQRPVYLSLPQKSNTASHDSGPYPIETNTNRGLDTGQSDKYVPPFRVGGSWERNKVPSPRTLQGFWRQREWLLSPVPRWKSISSKEQGFNRFGDKLIWQPPQRIKQTALGSSGDKGEQETGAKPCEGVWERKSLRLVSPELCDQDLHRTRI